MEFNINKERLGMTLQYITMNCVEAIVELDFKSNKTSTENEVTNLFSLIEKMEEYNPTLIHGNFMGTSAEEQALSGLLVLKTFNVISDYYGELLNKANRSKHENNFVDAVNKISDEFIDHDKFCRSTMSEIEKDGFDIYEYANKILMN